MTKQANKKSNFRDLCRNFKVSKYAKIFGIIPLVVVLVALIIVVAVGTKSGSFTDAVGIGID
ncbi:MAG: hypothetical protein K2G31_00015, partial [Clostridia bacterium]|nr:hypothetical protein [Clostridia bacterium]